MTGAMRLALAKHEQIPRTFVEAPGREPLLHLGPGNQSVPERSVVVLGHEAITMIDGIVAELADQGVAQPLRRRPEVSDSIVCAPFDDLQTVDAGGQGRHRCVDHCTSAASIGEHLPDRGNRDVGRSPGCELVRTVLELPEAVEAVMARSAARPVRRPHAPDEQPLGIADRP